MPLIKETKQNQITQRNRNWNKQGYWEKSWWTEQTCYNSAINENP